MDQFGPVWALTQGSFFAKGPGALVAPQTLPGVSELAPLQPQAGGRAALAWPGAVVLSCSFRAGGGSESWS